MKDQPFIDEVNRYSDELAAMVTAPDADARKRATVRNVQDRLKRLTLAYDAGEISQTAYFRALAKLQRIVPNR